jgi:hypothetical protein
MTTLSGSSTTQVRTIPVTRPPDADPETRRLSDAVVEFAAGDDLRHPATVQ